MNKTPQNLHNHVCEEKLFSQVFKTHAKNLYNFIYYKYGEHTNPEDQVQEAFIKLWDNCHKVPLAKVKSFLFTVANNLTLNQLKHHKIKLRYHQEEGDNKINNEHPLFILEEKEYLKKYQKALTNLTEPQRIAFLMNRTEGKKHKEIAEILGISRKAVEKRIYGALKKLRKDIEGL